ncbi:MAG: SirB2 family protein [Methylococcales bacterium]|nr:SirB2 family protein [Methylococcales bacterium]
MIKLIHIIFIFTSFISFFSRVTLSVFKPAILQNKIIKIAPHVIDTILLVSGIVLVIQGNWLDGEFGWILSKFILLLCYIILGVMAMRLNGAKRWVAFAGAIACYVYIFIIAISKTGFILFTLKNTPF